MQPIIDGAKVHVQASMCVCAKFSMKEKPVNKESYSDRYVPNFGYQKKWALILFILLLFYLPDKSLPMEKLHR